MYFLTAMEHSQLNDWGKLAIDKLHQVITIEV